MKVLVVLPDVAQYGGMSRFLERLLDIHARRGIDTILLVSTDQCHPALVLLAKRYGADLVRSPNRTTRDTAPILSPIFDLLFSWRTVLTSRPDLIVVSTGDPGRLSIAFYFPKPVLYILHTIPEHKFRLLPRLYLRIGSMFNNGVMTVSKAAAGSVAENMGILRNKIEVVYNSYGIAPHRKEADRPIVLTTGHLVNYKNPDVWLEVARVMLQERPGLTFVWLGDGELLQSTRDKVKALSLEGRILLPGYVVDPSKWYGQAHIYFQPSLRENHSIAVLEAMAQGLPCVVANTGGLPETVVDRETGYVCAPADSVGFAERIRELLDNRTLRDQMGSAGKQRVNKCFSEAVQESRIISLYSRLVKKG